MSVVIIPAYCSVVFFVLMKIIDIMMMKVGERKGTALSKSEQMVRSDIVEHGEPSYLI